MGDIVLYVYLLKVPCACSDLDSVQNKHPIATYWEGEAHAACRVRGRKISSAPDTPTSRSSWITGKSRRNLMSTRYRNIHLRVVIGFVKKLRMRRTWGVGFPDTAGCHQLPGLRHTDRTRRFSHHLPRYRHRFSASSEDGRHILFSMAIMVQFCVQTRIFHH